MKAKVLFITHYTDLYGANRSLINLIEGLGNKIEAEVLTPRYGDLTEYLRSKKITCHIRPYTIAFTNNKNHLIHIFKRIKFLPRLIKLIIKSKPDIIYSNSSVIDYGFFLSKIFNIPHVWHIREFGKEDFNVSYDGGNLLFKYLLKKSKANIAISNSVRQKISPFSNTVTIYNGVVKKDDIKSEPKTISNKHIKIGIIGQISPQKNQLEAVTAFYHFNKNNPQSTLHIIGDGDKEYISMLKQYITEKGITDKVIFTGFVKNTSKYYSTIDIILMCSLQEAFGRVTIEAMANGIPVIGRDSGGTTEIIHNKINGCLYSNTNILVKHLEEMTHNPEYYQQLSNNAIISVQNMFTLEKYSSEVYSVLKSISISG